MKLRFLLVLVGFAIPFAVSSQERDGGHDLTVRDFVEALADYDVKHVQQQPFFQPAYGVTNFESEPPAVWIFSTGDTVSRRMTVIHEFLHVHYHQHGLNPPEEFIATEEIRLYAKFFLAAER